MAIKNFNKIACLLLSLVLVFSLFSISVFATEASDTTEAVTNAEDVVGGSEEPTPEESQVESTPDESQGESTPEESQKESAPESESGENGTTDNTSGTSEESKKISTGTIVSIAIVLVIIVVAAVYCIKNREKVAKFFRECKSELKKITWTPKNQVAKNTFVVIVVVIAAAIFVALLDLLFSTGIGLLGNL